MLFKGFQKALKMLMKEKTKWRKSLKMAFEMKRILAWKMKMD